MSLLALPAEVRLYIYDFLPDLQPGRQETVTGRSRRLTPSICRVSQALRHETLPIFAAHSSFDIQIESTSYRWDAHIAAFLDVLGSESIARIQSFKISCHWNIPQPMRWQGHVGFYVRLEKRKLQQISSPTVNTTSVDPFRPEWNARFVRPMSEGAWEVTTGTYPIARDMRGMRFRSVELLADIVRNQLRRPSPRAEVEACRDASSGLRRGDIELLHRAMDIVAARPIATSNFVATSPTYRDLTWSIMEEDLHALSKRYALSAQLPKHEASSLPVTSSGS